MSQPAIETTSRDVLGTSPASSVAAVTPRLLHLGCGLIAPVEWVNVDASYNAWFAQHPLLRKVVSVLGVAPKATTSVAWPKNILIANLNKRLPFRDNSFDAVYSSHTIEHMYRDTALATLREARRVLKPGGHCRNLVPDLATIVRDYMRELQEAGQSAGGGGAPNAGADPARQMIMRTGLQGETPPRRFSLYAVYQSLTEFNSHKWMYDVLSLQRLMEEAGFANCQPRGYLESDIPHLAQVEHLDRATDGAIVEGIKL